MNDTTSKMTPAQPCTTAAAKEEERPSGLGCSEGVMNDKMDGRTEPVEKILQENHLVDQETETSLGGPIQYHCDFCQKDITDVFRIRCAECPDFDLCTSCFTAGVETGAHLNTHSYIPIGNNDFSLFTADWTADEEVMLLEGVSKYGFGNWAEVADLVSAYNTVPKTREQCEAHYYDIHIAPFCEKPYDDTLDVWFGPSRTPDMSNAEHRKILQDQMIGQYHRPMPKPLATSPMSSCCKVVGFMPLRGDFDVEYDNEAELVLSDIEFRGDETPQERELKLKVIDIYNAKLDERLLRKRVLIERGLADWRKMQHSGKKKPKEEVELRNLFGYLVRFDIPIDPDELVELILTERMLRNRLKVLHEWQSLGLQTYQDVQDYETCKSGSAAGMCLPSHLTVDGSESFLGLGETPNSLGHGLSETLSSGSLSSNGKGCQDLKTKNIQHDTRPVTMTLEAPASQYPGAELLSSKELDFCDQLQLPPIYFLFTKYTLLNAMAEQEGSLALGRLDALHLDGVKVGSVFDFILHSEMEIPCSSESAKPSSECCDVGSSATPALQGHAQRQRLRRRLVYLEEPDESTSQSAKQEEPDQAKMC